MITLIVFGLFFTALSNALSSIRPSGDGIQATPLRALQALSGYTPARPGDRTLVDSLAPFCDSLAAGDGLSRATELARQGAEKTSGMKARLGRATYVGAGEASDDEQEKQKIPPDPGAWGVAALLEGLEKGLKGGH